MHAVTRVGAGALSASLVSVALLGSGAGVAFAQEADDCDLNGYPPQQCATQGGASAGAPPLVVNRTVAAPGDPVTVTGTGCTTGSTVTLELLRVAKPGGGRQSIGSTTADEDGGFDLNAVIPANAANGVYLLYSTCVVNGVPQLRITSFVIAGQPASAGSSRTASQRTATPESDAKVFAAAVADADLPAEWSAPAGWQDSPATKAALSRAVNLELAALRQALPASDVVAAPPAPAATDITPWAAGAAGAVFLLLGAAGWRRHAAKAATTDEVAQ